MYKYGILSTASIIDRFIAGIRESQDGEVIAIASRTIEKAKASAQRLGIERYYGSYEELFEDEDIDIIYIPTVNGLHYRDCMNALKHHKHVIVEKPFTLTIKEAKELFDYAKQQHCFLMEAQKSVFLPVTQKVKDMIENHIIGNIQYIELKAGFPQRFDYYHWMYDLSMGGGALYGSASYTIEYLDYLFNPTTMVINGDCIKCLTGSDELCHFLLNIDHHLIASSTISMNVGLKNEAVFYGEKGYIVVDHYWKAKQCDVYLNDGTHNHFDFPYQSEFVYEINHIHDCLSKGLLQSPIMNQERTFLSVELVENMYKKWM